MLKKSRVVESIERVHSMESSMFTNMFKNLFKKQESKFEHSEYVEFKSLFETMDKTIFKKEWAEKNIDELLTFKFSKSINPIFSLYEGSEEFIKADDLLKSLKKFNDWVKALLKEELEIYKISNQAFKELTAELSFLKKYKNEDEVSDEDSDIAIELIQKNLDKYKPKIKKLKDKITAKATGTPVKFNKNLEYHKGSINCTVSDEQEFKITRDELITFLKGYSNDFFEPWDHLYEFHEVPYFDSGDYVFWFEEGRVDYNDVSYSGNLVQHSMLTLDSLGPLQAEELFKFCERAINK